MSFLRAERQRFESVLRGASGRALGRLSLLDLSQHHVRWRVLLPVLAANVGSLRELYLFAARALNFDASSTAPIVEAVVAAAPQLQALTAEVMSCAWEDAPRVLRSEPPFAQLQLRCSLEVHFDGEAGVAGGMDHFGPFAAEFADAALQPGLTRLCVGGADTAQPALMDALVDAALARRLQSLKMEFCSPPAAAPLARLLAEGSLAVLDVGPPGVAFTPLFDAAGAALVADALRMNTTLTKLYLYGADLCLDMRVAGALLGALVGHPSLSALRILFENTTRADCGAFGAALAALIAADAPALQSLVCFNSSLRDAGLTPVVEALALNHHLGVLDLRGNSTSKTFARKRLLPAVRLNTTLRELSFVDGEPDPAATEAEELVRQRGQHD